MCLQHCSGLHHPHSRRSEQKQPPTMACSILLSMATTLAPEELKDKQQGWSGFCQQGDVTLRRAGLWRNPVSAQVEEMKVKVTFTASPVINRDRVLPEHRGQERYGEIPQLTNTQVHRHRVTLRVHATPRAKHPNPRAGELGSPVVQR